MALRLILLASLLMFSACSYKDLGSVFKGKGAASQSASAPAVAAKSADELLPNAMQTSGVIISLQVVSVNKSFFGLLKPRYTYKAEVFGDNGVVYYINFSSRGVFSNGDGVEFTYSGNKLIKIAKI
ncbi:MAG: hypothetical protein ACTTIC_01425 [Helicobacteraceae bacterium]